MPGGTLCRIFTPPIRTTPPPPGSTSSAPPNTPTSTRAATPTSTTPAPGWPRTRSCARTPSGCAAAVSATRTRTTRPRARPPGSSNRPGSAVLRYFNAAADEYAVIFTQNATGACRLVGESYQFRPLSRLVLTADNHNSVNGIREFARARGAATRYVRLSPADLRAADEDVAAALGRGGAAGPRRGACSPIRRRATSAASSIRWPGWITPRPRATTCCSTRRPSSRPTGSTSARSSPSS